LEKKKQIQELPGLAILHLKKKKNFFGFDWNMMLVFKLMGLTLIRGEFYFVD
jgi:hypothetical protein